MDLGSTLFGIPLVFWGIGCLAIAVAYYRIWPVPSPKRAQPRTRTQHIILRYFHALVWVLLAAGCFLAGSGYASIGLVLAAAALPVYIVFLAMLVQDRQRELADLAAQRKALQGKPTGSQAGSGQAGSGQAGSRQPAANQPAAGQDGPGQSAARRPSGSVSK